MLDKLPGDSIPIIKGRGAAFNPQNRFEKLQIEPDPEIYDADPNPKFKTEYYLDNTKEILAKNNSPDISFTYSINPYRGCEHGCLYCYARPTHEFFGLSAGLDFETKILVKQQAAQLLERKFRSRRWQPQVIAFSGNTDCYQPIEKQFGITRKCLEVFLKYRNPLGIITKNALILRDLDLLQALARKKLVAVTLSVTTLDNKLCRKMEPRTSSPFRRLDALEKLVAAGIPTGVNVAPIVPGLNDHEISQIIAEAAARGVRSAGYILMRLPYSVKEIFFSWLRQHYPDREKKVLNAVRDTRSGQLNDPCFGSRMRGEGRRADAIERLFRLSCQKYCMNVEETGLSTAHFRNRQFRQGELFS